ncbi:MAG: hypothetical protein LC792_07570, partial [Actinobacteria bacterium]|nr:hypothetical protein [Actinomycetota bacterium]
KSSTNAQGNALAYTYDTAGNLTTTQNGLAAGQNQFRTDYNANGTARSTTDAMGNVTSYGYDTAGNLTAITPPPPLGATTIGYDGLSRVTSVTDAKGQRTTYAYDALDRVTQITYASGSTVTYTYDAAGRVTQRADSGADTTTFSYDALNRLTSRSARVYTFSATYDGVGNMTSTTNPGGTVAYAYNQVNELATLTEPGAKVTTFLYDPAGRRTSTAYPNGVTQTIAYDNSGRQTRIRATNAGGGVLSDFSYSYANPSTGADTGLRQRVIDLSGTTTYAYDVLDRVVDAAAPGRHYSYAYDADSNRTSSTLNGASTTYANNAANQMTGVGSTTYSYDANGNQTANSAGQALAYNDRDQTTSTKAPGALAPTFMNYDGPGQAERVGEGADKIQYGLLGAEIVGQGLVVAADTYYTRDSGGNLVGTRTGGNNYYYLFDGLGSVVALTDSAGNVANRYSYDPYGNTVSASGSVFNVWGFAGGFIDHGDATGLVQFGQRYYDPAVGRWTQQDPVGPRTNYLYAGDDPLNFVDPSGMNAVSDFFTKSGKCIAKELESPTSNDVVSHVSEGVGGDALATGAAAFGYGAAGLAAGIPLAVAGGALVGYGVYHSCHHHKKK